MKKFWSLVIGVCVILWNGCQVNSYKGKYQKSALEKRIEYISQKTKKSIVTLEVVKEYYALGKKQKFISGGSGSIISKDGLILTNYHVAGDAKKIFVSLWNKKKVPAEIVGEDPLTDLALVKLKLEKLKGMELEPIKIGNYEKISEGDFVLALGSPYLLSQTASFGVVANKRRVLRMEFEAVDEQVQAEHPIVVWIHHTAPIFGGNSGGPLVNLDGELIGVNARGGGGGMSFSIAVDVVQDVVERLSNFKRPKWAYYGWKFSELKDELKEFYKLPEDFEGVFISDVVFGSPAYNAGIRSEDILVSIDGLQVSAKIKEDIPPIMRMLSRKELHKPVNVIFRRKDGQVISTKVIPEEWEIWETPLMANEPGFQREKDFHVSDTYGFSVQRITKKFAVKERLEEPWGVFCTGTETGSIATNAGLMGGDIIKYIDDKPITDIDTFKKIIMELEKIRPEKIKIKVLRGNSLKYIFFKDHEKIIKKS